jgi:hypothetical protein
MNYANAYHPSTGVFIVPETGVYVFTWTYRVRNGGYHSVQLMKNTEEIAVLYARTVAGTHDEATGIVPVHALKGDDVFLRTHGSYNSDEVTSDEDGRSYFSGWKLS